MLLALDLPCLLQCPGLASTVYLDVSKTHMHPKPPLNLSVLQGELGQALIRYRKIFKEVAAYSFVINLLMLLPAIYMMQLYDRVLSSRNGMTLLMLTFITLALFALHGVLDWVRARLLIRVGVQLDRHLSERIYTAAMERLLKRREGFVVQSLQDLTTLRQFVAGSGIHAFFDAPWAPIYLVFITLLHPWLGVFSLLAMLVLCALAWLNEIFTHGLLEASNQEAQRAHLFASNNMRGAETLSALGMLNKVRLRWGKHQDRVLQLQMQASERAGNIGSLSKTLRIAFQSLILGLGAWLAIEEMVSPGAMIAASILMGRALAPVDQLIGVWRQWLGAKAAFERLDQLVRDYPAPPPHVSLPPPKGDVLIEGVSVIPPGAETPVIKNLSLRIPAGDVVGVIGPSGAGKSSLARLLVGVWSCSQGNARLDGASIFDWPKEELGPCLGYLPQDIALFEGTVAENIARYGELDSDKIVQAAKAAGVHDMILRLPSGYQTNVGVDGGTLSGGQRQRIALARALYGDPCLIVLDEPNSNLDEVGEIALVEAIRHAKQRGATVVFISHNKRLIGVAEKLLVMRDGSLSAYGPQDQVLDLLQKGQVATNASQAAAKLPAGGQA